jgi:HupE / UreJ protein
VLFALCAVAALSAHDIPNDVSAQLLLKPEGQRLRLLVRVPLGAMRDMDYPKRLGAANSDLLDLSRADATLRDAATLWVGDFLDLYENDVKLPAPTVVSVRASLQSDRSFASYDEALAHVTGPPLDPASEFFWSQGLLDILFEYPIQSDRSLFSIDPRLARLGIRTKTALRVFQPDGTERVFEFQGDPGLVRLDPRWFQAVWLFVSLGFAHVLGGADHLVFLLCLAIPFRRVRPLVALVTAFTIAHTITMFAAASNLAPDVLWFPPLVETLIATAIVYLALENIVYTAVPSDRLLKRRWFVAFAFGLLHGFGFSFGLGQTLQFAGSHVVASILAFNAGLEVAQVLVVAIAIAALDLVFRRLVAERLGTILLSAIAAHTAWHWMSDRWAILRQFRFEWPAIDALFWVAAMRWMMLVVVAAGLYWVVFNVLGGESSPPQEPVSSPRV